VAGREVDHELDVTDVMRIEAEFGPIPDARDTKTTAWM
jgi:hypothetical protein